MKSCKKCGINIKNDNHLCKNCEKQEIIVILHKLKKHSNFQGKISFKLFYQFVSENKNVVRDVLEKLYKWHLVKKEGYTYFWVNNERIKNFIQGKSNNELHETKKFSSKEKDWIIFEYIEETTIMATILKKKREYDILTSVNSEHLDKIISEIEIIDTNNLIFYIPRIKRYFLMDTKYYENILIKLFYTFDEVKKNLEKKISKKESHLIIDDSEYKFNKELYEEMKINDIEEKELYESYENELIFDSENTFENNFTQDDIINKEFDLLEDTFKPIINSYSKIFKIEIQNQTIIFIKGVISTERLFKCTELIEKTNQLLKRANIAQINKYYFDIFLEYSIEKEKEKELIKLLIRNKW